VFAVSDSTINQDRAHRIGQRRPVVVYRLITSRSCESRLVRLTSATLLCACTECRSVQLRRATDKLKLESLVIKKGNFVKRTKVSMCVLMLRVKS
jgi:hypothetical protein